MEKNIFLPAWENAENLARAELVFENRNKEYGGYSIRKWYETRLHRAFLYSLTGFVLLILSPYIIELLSKTAENIIKATNEVVITLTQPPAADAVMPPPLPPPIQPLKKTIAFVPPVVKEEPVENNPPPQEELSKATVSTVTNKGEEHIDDLPPEEPADPNAGKIFTVVEEMPSFPGGETKLFEFLRKNTRYPGIALESDIEGIVYVTFIVGKDGKIADAKVIRGIGGGCDEEALRVVRAMPDWISGKQNGRPVTVQYILPVNFKIKKEYR